MNAQDRRADGHRWINQGIIALPRKIHFYSITKNAKCVSYEYRVDGSGCEFKQRLVPRVLYILTSCDRVNNLHLKMPVIFSLVGRGFSTKHCLLRMS